MQRWKSAKPHSGVWAAGDSPGSGMRLATNVRCVGEVAAGAHREAGVAVADDVDGTVPARGLDGVAHAAHVVLVAREGQIDGLGADAARGETIHHEQPAPSPQMGSMDEQHG